MAVSRKVGVVVLGLFLAVAIISLGADQDDLSHGQRVLLESNGTVAAAGAYSELFAAFSHTVSLS